MKKLLSFSCLVLTSMVLVSCNRPIQSREALTNYLKDSRHGLTQVHEINKVKAAVTFMPWQVIANRLYRTKQQDTSVLKVIKSKYYFVLDLSANGKELLRQLPFAQYSDMVQVLAFQMRPFVSIVRDDGKVIAAEDCLFQQTYGMGRENEVLLIFNRSELNNTYKMNLEIREFGLNTGNLDYQINTEDISQMPIIDIN
jgi:hypothetical protein